GTHPVGAPVSSAPAGCPLLLDARAPLLVLTVEVRRVAGIAFALVFRNRRVEAQRACRGDAVGWVVAIELRRQDLVWRDALLDPFHQRAEHIEGVWTGAASTMQYPRSHEQSVECLGLVQCACALVIGSVRLLRHDALVVPD